MRWGFLSIMCMGLCICGCSDTNLSRIDLQIFQDKKTGAIIFAGRPTKITDGDTIVLANSIKIRMAGIDAPESRQQCADEKGNEYACGDAATRHLMQIIGDGRVQCALHGSDRYGRYLMTCYKPDGTDIHAQMVRDGYAVVSTYDPDIYLGAENEARENKRGIWRGTFHHPHCYRHRKKQNWTVRGLCDGDYTGWDGEKYTISK